jgi:type I restriction enzyme S subunit
MSRKFAVKAVPSSWLEDNGHRLDCGPYLSGAIEAREQLKKHDSEPLSSVTTSIFHAGRESRQWVETPEYGVPFLGSTDILAADLTGLPLISKKQVQANPGFVIHEGYTLITRSGTIGRMAYCRPDMEGMACSEHAMRVAPDKTRIQPGYLYAFLSSRFGVPLVVGGTYGSIIQSIEPAHIADLPVPRLDPAIESTIDALVQSSARAHTRSRSILLEAGSVVNEACKFPSSLARSAHGFAVGQVGSNALMKRLDASYHNPIAGMAEQLVESAGGIPLGESGVVGLESQRLKQIFVDEGYGTPFITSSSIFLKTIVPERHLRSTSLGDSLSWRIDRGDTLVARSGQIGGIIGRGVFADARLDGFAASPHILRLRSSAPTVVPEGYLFAFLCLTDVGYQLLARTAAGSSIPFLPLPEVLSIPIPMTPSIDLRLKISNLVTQASVMEQRSQELESQALSLLESSIEGSA